MYLYKNYVKSEKEGIILRRGQMSAHLDNAEIIKMNIIYLSCSLTKNKAYKKQMSTVINETVY